MHSWMQYHGNSANQGLMLVHTSVASKPKWWVDVGLVGYVSPVIGSDGVIYVGLLNGELVAVHSDGNIKWRRAVTLEGNPDYPGMIMGSPAIGKDGNIYIITTVDITRRDRRNEASQMIQVRRSSLHSFTPAGNRRWSYRFPANTSGLGAYTASSPKVWGDQNIFIFVPALYTGTTSSIEILVLNQSGNLVNRTEVTNDIPLPMNADFMACSENFDIEKVPAWPEPTLAMVDLNHQPIIVIVDNYKTLLAYRWNFPVLMPLWSSSLDVACQRTSPVVFSNDEVLLGDQEGAVSCYDVKSGRKIHQPWYQADHSVVSPPVLCEGKIYFVAGNELMMLNANVKIEKRYVLSGKCLGSLALSANHIYVSTTEGFYSFSLDLKNVYKNGDIAGGMSTPAMSPNGSVYVIDQKGVLFAF